MKTTLELPDELVREMKIRAVREGKKLKVMAAELLRRGMASSGSGAGSRVSLPLVECRHPAKEGERMTPERVAGILLDQEVEAHHGAGR